MRDTASTSLTMGRADGCFLYEVFLYDFDAVITVAVYSILNMIDKQDKMNINLSETVEKIPNKDGKDYCKRSSCVIVRIATT